MQETVPQSATSRRWNPRSVVLPLLAWLLLQIGGLFTPGLLDDVDSIYIEIAREMLQRHDFVTPYINGIRFFDKPPLMYWMAAGSMHLFGIHDWAARLPLALAVLALLLAVYALGIRLFNTISPTQNPDRAGFYAALAMATSIGPYLYTRFYIPDILLALWMTLAVHLFLIALDRIQTQPESQQTRVPHRDKRSALLNQPQIRPPPLPRPSPPSWHSTSSPRDSSAWSSPSASSSLYLAITRQLHLLVKLHLLASTAVFLAHRRPVAHPRRPPQPSHRPTAGPGPSRNRRLGLVLSLQRAHRPLPLQTHPARLRPHPRLALLALPRALDHALGHLPPHRHRRCHPHPPHPHRHNPLASTKPHSPSSSGRSSSLASSPSPTGRSTTASPRSPPWP